MEQNNNDNSNLYFHGFGILCGPRYIRTVLDNNNVLPYANNIWEKIFATSDVDGDENMFLEEQANTYKRNELLNAKDSIIGIKYTTILVKTEKKTRYPDPKLSFCLRGDGMIFCAIRAKNGCTAPAVDRVKNTSMDSIRDQKSLTSVKERSCIIEKENVWNTRINEACSLASIAEINKK